MVEIIDYAVDILKRRGYITDDDLNLGYTPEQIVGCWEKMRNGWWKGKELALARVLGNLGEYAKSSHSDGRIPEQYTEVDDL